MRRLSVILRLAAKSLANRAGAAVLTALAIAVAVTLFLGVEKIRQGARASFENTISGTDLIVGARSGAINLTLYAVFRMGQATNDIRWESYETIAARPEVSWTVPLSLGDSHAGFRVLGTTAAYFERYQYGGGRSLRLAEGELFVDLYDVVLGAAVARELGYGLGREITLSHGVGAVSFLEHANRPFRVSGVLAPTGTPVDRSLHVSLEAIEALHVGWVQGAPSPLARAISAEQVRTMNLRPGQITAFLVGLENKIDALRLQRAINNYAPEPLMAVIPGVALSQLWAVVGAGERALALVSAFVIVVGLVSIMTILLSSLNERRREMAILRAVGARPWHIFALLVSEAALLALIGAVVGVGLVQLAVAAAGPVATARFGLTLPAVPPSWFDAGVVAAVTGAAALLAAGPAWRATRNALNDGLTIRV